MFSVKREERVPAGRHLDRMNGHEEAGGVNGEYEFTSKISNSFADSIMASSPTKVLENNENPPFIHPTYFHL